LGERLRQVAGRLPERQAIASPGPRGERIVDDNYYLAVNAHHEPLEFRLPGMPFGERWQAVLETAKPLPEVGAIADGETSVRSKRVR
jgi:glycogen operon protein